jgi:hypothetical protein
LFGVICCLGGGSLGCENEEVKACHAEMQVSQKALLEMDKTDPKSVRETLGLVEKTLAVCEAAQRREEVKNIADAKRQVSAHLEALEERAARPERKKLSADEVAKLEREGDPNCPRGQGYEHPQSKQVIKCVGKQLAEMPKAVASEHFDKRGYKITEAPDGGFKAEFGASAYEMRYAAGPGQAPTCVRVTGKPGVPWQEIVARTTGVHPQRIKRDKPVKVGGNSLPLKVAGDPAQWTVILGDCGSDGG